VPRGPYARQLEGIPTIRVFEALACGIPLISAPWSDAEGLFPAGCYIGVSSGETMTASLAAVLSDADLAASLVRNGLDVVRERHTCRHRAQELLDIFADIGSPGSSQPMAIQRERIAS
jgi:spore maturation protein CgeB